MNDSLHLDLFRSDHLTHARRRVFRQLIESLVFENVVRVDVQERQYQEGIHTTISIPGRDADRKEVAYLARGRRASFGRIRLAATPVMRVAGGRQDEADSLSQFLLETGCNHGADADRLGQFIVELEQTVLKHAQAEQHGGSRRSAQVLSYDELETACGDGHPYHPSFKSRLGFDLEDNARFGPEFGPTVRPIWLAAIASATVRAAARGLNVQRLLEREVGGPTWERWRAQVDLESGQYALIPVHPWQWREQIVSLYHDDLRRGRLVPLGITADEYRPQQSIRTLANRSSPSKCSLKHALSIVNTSTARILAPHTVANAPLVSDWLCGLAQADPFLTGELRTVFLREVLGAAYDPPQPELLQPRSYGVLSCIWRESVFGHLAGGEQAIPWTALTHRQDQRPVIDPWIRVHGPAWVERLIEVAVLPLVHLLIAHGVALEAHAQNMVLILRDGLPTRVALKDFHDGIRFCPLALAEPQGAPALHATPARHVRVNRNSYVTAESPQAVRDFLFDAFFFINLGELAMFLADHFDLPEDWFWAHVDAALAGYERRFPHLATRVQLFGLRAATIQVEKLTNRRLFPETDVQTHSVPLPFGRGAQVGGLT